MASPRKPRWKTWQRVAGKLVADQFRAAASDGPRLIRQLQDIPSVQHGIRRGIEEGIKIGMEALAAGAIRPAPAIPAGRPVSTVSAPTAHRARKLIYAPNLNGRADPGEIVWAWVVYADDPNRGKDRPVLVVGRDRQMLLGLMLSSQDRHHSDPNWIGIGVGSWDYAGRPSWVRLDRVLDVPEEGIRREGAILDRATFELVASRLRADYSWS